MTLKRKGKGLSVCSIIMKSFLWLFMCGIMAFMTSVPASGGWIDQTRIPITTLKNQHLDTVLVESKIPQAILVAPVDGRYDRSVEKINRAIEKNGGVRLPVIRGSKKPEDLLKYKDVIALGNMSTNPFIEKLYCQWYALLDLKYPGKGGYVVRSLHNPYGTGHNVILIGGSDDQGVEDAADVLCNQLKQEDPLKLGWIMQVRLGDGLIPPEISEDGRELKWMSGWRNGWRLLKDGKRHGSGRSFGWNPISAAGALYYMTGDKSYLDHFKSMVKPDWENMPKSLLESSAFEDPYEPLVAVSEYHDHLMECIWDLIEESPEFGDEERLYITQQLYEHQLWRSLYGVPKDDSFLETRPGRHTAYKLLGIYTGSRYFGNYLYFVIIPAEIRAKPASILGLSIGQG